MTTRVGVDIGGTFTDLVAIFPDGSIHVHKISSRPGDYARAILDGLKILLLGQPIDEILHATTVGSNAILQGETARTALLTTRGFRDILEIRDLRMPRLYDIDWTKPPPLVPRHLRFEIDERVRPDASVERAPDPRSVADAIRAVRQAGVQAVAISFLHSYANPHHEQMIASLVRQILPGVAVTASHEILPEIEEYPRTSTTVVNAALQPIARTYIANLSNQLAAAGITAPVHLMQSNGGLATTGECATFPARLVESGPAAGVVGAAALAAHLGEPRLITFDMGGTTAKAALVEDGQVSRTDAMEIGAGIASARFSRGGGYLLKLPSIDLAEVGAGGGSICRIDSVGAPKVGPDSAGADPGPVCYRRGGLEPTITDCNLVLGYLDPDGLAGGEIKVDRDAAAEAVARKLAAPLGLGVEEAAHGMIRIASATMMRAIRAVSVERGRDCRDFTLMAFGGNGPLFAASIARELAIRTVIVPPMPGLFSALGLLFADVEHHLSRSLRIGLAEPDIATFKRVRDELLTWGNRRLADGAFPPARRWAALTASVRYVGQSSHLRVPLPPGDAAMALRTLTEVFAAEHLRSNGFRAPPGEPAELTGLSIVARGLPERPRLPASIPVPPAIQTGNRRIWLPGSGWETVPVIGRGSLTSSPQAGPLLIQEYDATCLVPPGSAARIDEFGNIRITLD